ncbi:MAG TPA: ABC transporter permease [Baekduia sp.]|nr:ABC transporter permease [Baekduia sp.]
MSVSRLKDLMGRAGEGVVALFPLAWLAVLFAVPLGFTLVYSFAHATFGGMELGTTLENYQQALSGFYLDIFWRTVRFALMGTALVLLVAIPVAYATARKSGRFKTVLLLALLIPFWTSFLVRAMSWRTLLEPNGPVQDMLNFLHLHSGTLEWLDNPPAVFIGIVYGYLPLAAIPLFVAFERISPAIVEAGKDLGGGRWKTFFNVTLPMARPGLFTAAILTFTPMMGEFVIPALLGGNRGVLYGNLIDSQYLDAANYPLGSAMAVLLLIVLGVAIALLARLTKGFKEVPA